VKTKDVYEALIEKEVIKIPQSADDLWVFIKATLENRAIEIDEEAIYSNTDYSSIFSDYAKAFRKDLGIGRQDVKSFYDKEKNRAGISVTIEGEELSAEWDQDSDWIAPEFYDFLANKVEPRLPGKFVSYVNMDQVNRSIYLPNEVADSISSLFKKYEKRR